MSAGKLVRVAVVAPSCTLDASVPDRVQALAGDGFEIVFHPQCFLSHGHFAGPDQAREDALVEVANDPEFDAVWFARGGYGACRIAERAIARINGAAQDKVFLGYSDAGYLLAGLHARGVGRSVHAPMPADIRRVGGEVAVQRTLDWLAAGGERTSEADLPFNLTVLSQLLGTSLQPDFTRRILMLEDVDEPMYRIDRSLFHVTANPEVRKAAGLRLGRFSNIPPNTPDFDANDEQLARHWCDVSGIAYLGRAGIGHDIDNIVVPFG